MSPSWVPTPCPRHFTVPYGAEAPSGHVDKAWAIPLPFLRPALPILRPVQRYDNFKLKTSKTAVVLIAGVTVSPSRVLRAPGTSLYCLVPKHLRATWTRPEQSHLLPEACSPNGTYNKRQRQRRIKRPPPEPSDILKRFYALYDNKLRYYMKKMSKLYYLLNPILHTVINW